MANQSIISLRYYEKYSSCEMNIQSITKLYLLINLQMEGKICEQSTCIRKYQIVIDYVLFPSSLKKLSEGSFRLYAYIS